MAYKRRRTAESLPSDPAYQVVLRPLSELEKQEVQFIFAAKLPTGKKTGELDVPLGTFDVTDAALYAVQAAIVSWNLDDEDGKLLPVDAESFKDLASEDQQFILRRAVVGTVLEPFFQPAQAAASEAGALSGEDFPAPPSSPS